MKRAIALIFVTAACIVGFLSVRGTLPFMPIYGSSMEPTMQSGALLMIEPIEPQDVKVGDIIVYNVSSMLREYYNYPPVVAHRVIEVNTVPQLSFRTKGDNTGEDPFTIRPQDIRGTVGDQIPYLGLPLLFFQSQQGMIFVIIALALLALFLYGRELGLGGRVLHRGIFSPVINEEKRANRLLTRKIESTEQKINMTEQALEKFSSAVAEYAQHLASHTSAIQGLSEASHELKRSSAEQNRVLMTLMQTTMPPLPSVSEPSADTHKVMEPAKPPHLVELKPQPEAEMPEPEEVKPETAQDGDEETQHPVGCARGHYKKPTVEEIQKKFREHGYHA